MVDRVFSQLQLSDRDIAFLQKLALDMPILSDVCRADLLLCCRLGKSKAMVVAQAMPHSVASVYEEQRTGRTLDEAEDRSIVRAFQRLPSPKAVETINARGANIARQIFPVWNDEGKLIAVLAKDSYWLAYERQLRRKKPFQRAVTQLSAMALRGVLRDAESLTPFGEHDGIMYVSADRQIRYMSGVASNLYRSLGYRDNLVGRRVYELDTVDAELVAKALTEQRCYEQQDVQYGLTWTRKVVPVSVPTGAFVSITGDYFSRPMERPLRPQGALMLIHDATEILQKERELESKMSLLREVHHRVKNNLQVIASIMRMQARRAKSEEAQVLLAESVNRVLSVAVVHEFLSQNAQGTINLQEVAHRIIGQLQQGLIDPQKHIRLTLEGPAIWLPAERATQCALLINELVQNAIEHGMANRDEGNIVVQLVDRGEEVRIVVSDDGEGLPAGFDLATDANLGLNIVRSMVERDLKGRFLLHSDGGTQATVLFIKSVIGGN